MKRVILIVALAMVLVLAMSTLAMAVPSGGANNNPLGIERSGYTGTGPFGQAQSAFVADINAGLYPQWKNYGDFLKWWKADNGFKR